jgi:hypothetical protein
MRKDIIETVEYDDYVYNDFMDNLKVHSFLSVDKKDCLYLGDIISFSINDTDIIH